MTASALEAGSFRDPSGHIFEVDGRIYRTVTPHAAADFEHLRDSGILQELADKGRTVAFAEVDPSLIGEAGEGARYVVEHPRLPFVSYPYEWPFPVLKAAALFHLDLQLDLLERGVALSDASAYNVQFRGIEPVFIDMLSFRRYREGEYWIAHRQFCEQFLNPLLLRALLGVAHNAWYRGSLEGITTTDLARLLPLRRKVSWNVFTQVVLQAKLQAAALAKPARDGAARPQKALPRTAYRGMLRQLRRWISGLQPKDGGATLWRDYAESHSYASEEEMAKRKFVGDFVGAAKPAMLWDLGCNTGAFSAVGLEAGAAQVIGFDFDQGALQAAYARAEAERLAFLPLFLDAANPSPDQGWKGLERKGLQRRARADGILALAFEHHLAIGRNVPLDQLVAWLTGLAPCGVIEFVQKNDPMVSRMLSLRDDVFADYSEEAFVAALARNARVVRSETVSAAGRRLFLYDRS